MSQETFNGEVEIDESENEKYLGQIIGNDGSNVKNVENRAQKGIGSVNKIITILKNTPGCKYYFELAVIFKKCNSNLINAFSKWGLVQYHWSWLQKIRTNWWTTFEGNF